MSSRRDHLTVDGRRIPVSNLDKILYPETRYTKARVIDYYVRCSEHLIPHLKDRPVTLKRFPDGVTGEFFYEKDAPSFTPDWVKTFPVARREGGPDINYILINDLATLVWLTNLANLEIHPFLHRVPDLERPTYIVFDLDPGEGAGVVACARVALILHQMLGALSLQSFAKVSGSKGLQVYVPLNTDVTYSSTQAFAQALAQLVERNHRDLAVSEMAKHLRSGKVFIDWSQNADYKTTAGVYSLRAKSVVPYVSLPVDWDELTAAIKADDGRRLYWTPSDALKRLSKQGDLFAPVLTLEQNLPAEVAAHLQKQSKRRAVATSGPQGSLEAYEKKRNFGKTPEPGPARRARSRQGSRRRFVVQKHAASHVHYDFRLEMHGVLKSWAVPKGPPFALDERRLAMPTEDHPLEYLEFEGVIPKVQYGGGTVMVWDVGSYELVEGNYYKGFLRVHLDGMKLKGEWTLRRAREEGRDVWFLTKSAEKARAVSKADEDRSAVSGRTMAEIAANPRATWHSNRVSAPAEPALDHLPDAALRFVQPMLAKLVVHLPTSSGWIYELKLDGYRALVLKRAGEVTVYSRRGNRLNSLFPSLAGSFARLPEGSMLDGEIVALDKQGRPVFKKLQAAEGPQHSVYFYAFDLLALRGKDTRALDLTERKRLLEDFAVAGLDDPVRLSKHFEARADFAAAVREQGLEGVIAKRKDSRYETGERTGAWVKYKTSPSHEFVIGGYMPGPNAFESLLVGYYASPGKLIFNAKVKNGFTPALRRDVARRFAELETDVCPFANLPEPANARRGEALTAAVMKKCRWLRPKLVAQVEYTEWTEADHLRHSKFTGLREDKAAEEVTREDLA